jgi:hypothetical protein
MEKFLDFLDGLLLSRTGTRTLEPYELRWVKIDLTEGYCLAPLKYQVIS